MEPSILMNLTRGRIVHMLTTDGPATAPDLIAALSLNALTVNRALSALSGAGIIRATDATAEDSHPAYAVDSAKVVHEMAQTRRFFDPWL